MAFERLSINKNPNGGKLAFNGSAKSKTKGSNKPVPPRLTNVLPPALLPPTSRPPITNVLPPFGGAGPQTGGELPAFRPPNAHGPAFDKTPDTRPFGTNVNPNAANNAHGPAFNKRPFGTNVNPNAANNGRRVSSADNFQNAFQAWFDNNSKNGGHSVFAGFGDGAMVFGGGGKGNGGGGNRPRPPVTNDKPPVTQPPAPPPTQWGNPTAPFPQNPYDIPAPLQPANNPWLASLPQRDWMTMPSASPGYQQAPPPAPWRPPY